MKNFQHKNQWALILGGSSGLGLATAKKLAKHGLNICVVYRAARFQEEDIQEEFKTIRQENILFKAFNMDATNADKRNQIIEDLTDTFKNEHQIKAVIHSIAKGNLKPMISEEDTTLKHDDFALTINAMALSLYDWVKALFDAHLFSDDARIISFTSEGNTKAWRYYAAVSAAKVTLEAITRNIALEFAPYGIKANCIQAGVTKTAALQMIPNNDNIIKHSLKRNPNKRLTVPEDIANAVYVLCRDEAAWITGAIIPVDGGEHLV